MVPQDPWDLLEKLSPFGIAGDMAGNIVADGWTGIMLSLWSAGLWVLRLALEGMDHFLTPDLTEAGPAADVYRTTFWGAGALVLVMALVQLGVTGFRRDGKSLARVLIGVGQFVVVWAAWITYGIALLAACGGLTRALLRGLLAIDTWAAWNPVAAYDYAKGGIEVALATVLGILGLFLWVAAIGHFVVMLARAAALLVLAAVTPIAAAGLVSEAGRPWFWKSLRWFHAAAFTPVLTVLVMGVGIKLTTGVAQGASTSAAAAVGTAFPGVMLVLVSLVAPVALFKLLAFVDPGTSSGAAMRAGLGAAGGLQGLMSGAGPGGGQDSTGSAASSSSPGGQSQGESQGGQATSNRFDGAMAKLGSAGSWGAKGLSAVTSLGAAAAATGMDDLNQTGVGDSSYFPDHQRSSQRSNPDQRDPRGDNDGASGDRDKDPGGHDGHDQPESTPPGTVRPQLPPAPAGAGSGPAASGGGAGAAGGAAGAAAAVPPVV